MYDKLKDIVARNVREKITIAVQVGEIDIFSDSSINQILATLDKSLKSDDLTLMHKSWSSFIHGFCPPLKTRGSGKWVLEGGGIFIFFCKIRGGLSFKGGKDSVQQNLRESKFLKLSNS